MISTVLLDLDDTLYDEFTFIKSGFHAAAVRMSELVGGTVCEIQSLLIEIHESEGRTGVFDRVCEKLEVNPAIAAKLVDAYRNHAPTLSFFDEVPNALREIRKSCRVGVVTDGWLSVQQRKASALGLANHVDVVFFADMLGREFWKPHPAPFHACLQLLGTQATDSVIHVGDNPSRDIAGAQAAGIEPIRMLRPGGHFSSVPMDATVRTVTTLTDVAELVLENAPRGVQ